MKALSIKQPWASLIAHGIKNVENRTWRTNFRGKIYIHASGKEAGNLGLLLNDEQIKSVMNNGLPERPLSAIIGEVDIIDCVINHPSIWAEQSPYCPITGRPFFMSIENENGKYERTYGGPFDSYTVPVPDETAPGEYVTERYCHDSDQWMGTENIGKLTGIPKERKPIYNWVLANPVLYEKPILNVKGKLSFWEPTPNQFCMNCDKPYFGSDPEYCCTGKDCGCLGLPIEPAVCYECFNKLCAERKCRVCGCTEDDCRQCINKTGFACHWVEVDLCSACQDE